MWGVTRRREPVAVPSVGRMTTTGDHGPDRRTTATRPRQRAGRSAAARAVVVGLYLAVLVAGGVLAATPSADAGVETPEPEVGRTGLETAGSSDVGAYVAALRSSLHVPGVAVAVLDGDGVVSEDVEGVDGDGANLTRDTPFLIGSVAKSMTATLVLQQVRRGALDLDDRVGQHLPWLEWGDPTVEQLLTHTSGYAESDGLAVSERFDDAPGAVGRAATELQHTGRAGRYAYSSANYLVLGALLEEVEGRPFGEILRDDLLRPLGMEDTSGLAAGGETLPPGHRWWFGRPLSHDVGTDESGAPYGYVVSTLADLERWAAAQSGARPDVLPPDLLARLHEPRVTSSVDRYAYGWRVSGSGAGTLVHHAGATPGFFAHVLMRPADGRSVVVLADAYGEAQAPVLAAAAEDVLAIVDGGSAEPGRGDPVLTAAPWVLLAVALAGVLVVGVRTVRRRRGTDALARRRLLAPAAAAVVTLVLAALPILLGVAVDTLLTWSPDLALALGLAVAAWGLATVVLALPRRGVSAGTS